MISFGLMIVYVLIAGLLYYVIDAASHPQPDETHEEWKRRRAAEIRRKTKV